MSATAADDQLTIYERSVPGRRAFVAPALDVPRAAARRAPRARAAPRAAAAAARGLRARDRPPLQPPVQAQLRPGHGLLPARLLHDEAQPQAARARRRAPRSRQAAPAAATGARAGSTRADVAPAARARGDSRAAARVAAALRRVARRAGRGAAHACLSRGPRRPSHQGADPRHRPRHQPGDGHDGRLRGGQGGHRRAGQRRPRRPAGQGRRGRGLPDAHQPLHAGPVRDQHRGDQPDRARRRRDAVLRRRQPQRDHGHLPARGHGLRHRALQPAQVLHPAPRRRRAGRRADRRLGPDRALPAAPPGGPGAVRQRARTGVRAGLRPAQVDRPPARLPGQLRRVRALLCLHPLVGARRGCATSPRWRCSTPTTCWPDCAPPGC